MRSRAGPPRHQPHPLQVQHRLGHRDARSVKQLAQLRFARQPVARLQRPGLDVAVKILENSPVFGRRIRRIVIWRGRQLNGRFARSCHAINFPAEPGRLGAFQSPAWNETLSHGLNICLCNLPQFKSDQDDQEQSSMAYPYCGAPAS